MIDGICIVCEIKDFPQWRLRMPFEFYTPINTDDGTIKTKQKKDNSINGKLVESDYQTIKHTAEYQTYELVISEVIRAKKQPKYYLKINGSLHKNKFSGENYERFYHIDVINEINNLCNKLEINSKRVKIDGLEFGVNIKTDFSPHLYLTDNLVRYKHLQFNQYAPDRRNRRLGYECVLSQYRVKIYDKGLQYGLFCKLLRFEVRFNKMQKINECSIYSLHDLTKPNSMGVLKGLLLGIWNDVLLYEPMDLPDNAELTDLQKELIQCGNNPKYWSKLHKSNKTKYNYHRTVLKELIKKYGKGYHIDIKAKIEREWQLLLSNKLYGFTIKIRGKNVESDTPRRYCISCNKEITHQRDTSKFCSPKYVGVVEAHKCRNIDSNKRNNLKNKIHRIMSKGVLFDIEPFFICKVC
jgi:predicted RNA-binding Zn-ribbon protein involved in translation (DUF1610 family)